MNVLDAEASLGKHRWFPDGRDAVPTFHSEGGELMSRSVALFVLLALAWSFAGPGEAGDDAPVVLPPDRIDTLNSNLGRIAEALEALRLDQRVLLTLHRVDLAERRIAPLEDRLERARADVRADRDEIARLEPFIRQFENAVQEAVRAGVDPSTIPERNELDRIQAMTDLAQARLADAERRVTEDEDEIARNRKRIQILDEIVETLLEEVGD